jgi:guanylate cyclase
MRRFRNSQLLLTLILPFLLQLSLGGFVASGAVVIWGFTSPLGALLVGNPRTAHRWFVAFVGLLVAAPFVQPLVRTEGAFGDGVRLAFFVGNLCALTAIVFVLTRYFARKKTEAYELLDRERDKSERLLLNVLPAQIADELRRGAGTVAEDFDAITILFADVVGFTRLSEELTPAEMVDLLNAVFSYFDELVARYGVEKIRTVGDSYMVVAGAPTRRPDHAHTVAELALEMLDFSERVDHPHIDRMQFRIGINSGPATAGIIGHTKFHYDVWGDAVNVASRMESHGVPGRIQVGPATAALIADDFVLEPREDVEVKGKGTMRTWLLVGRH